MTHHSSPLFLLAIWMALAPGAAAQGPPETITAIQVHGNTLTSDEDVVKIAGLEVGMPLGPDTVEEASSRLRSSKQFQSVQVLKRFASIANPSAILIVIIVNQGPVNIVRTGDPDSPTRVERAHGNRLLFLPVLGAEDGYGVTYGARFALPTPVGPSSQLRLPLTWGGEKRAAAELDKTLTNGPFDRLFTGASITRRTNPFYEKDDDRFRLWVRGERSFARYLRAGTTLGWQRVGFPGADDHFGYGGADITFDTRIDPTLPRNAVYARAAWEHIDGVNRMDLELRGYIGVFRQNVLAIRAMRSDADGPLQPALKPLLGGMANLRGFKAGTIAGDSLLASNVELIVPLTSPLSFGRVGVSGFFDTGTAYDKGQRLADQTWLRGVGGSVWFSAAFLQLNIAVAHGIGSSTRTHFGAGVTF